MALDQFTDLLLDIHIGWSAGRLKLTSHPRLVGGTGSAGRLVANPIHLGPTDDELCPSWIFGWRIQSILDLWLTSFIYLGPMADEFNPFRIYG